MCVIILELSSFSVLFWAGNVFYFVLIKSLYSGYSHYSSHHYVDGVSVDEQGIQDEMKSSECNLKHSSRP
jgi:hypothetical protein